MSKKKGYKMTMKPEKVTAKVKHKSGHKMSEKAKPARAIVKGYKPKSQTLGFLTDRSNRG